MSRRPKPAGGSRHNLRLRFLSRGRLPPRTDWPQRDQLIARLVKDIKGKSWDLAVDLRLFDDTRPVLQAINARDRRASIAMNSVSLAHHPLEYAERE